MASPKDEHKQRYGIGAVARLTGLTDHTIRVWERRYKAVIAERAPNGRREYSPIHVEKLGLLKRLTDAGVSISRIANDPIEQLRARADEMSGFAGAAHPERVSVAALGEHLPAHLLSHERELNPVELVVADSSQERFVADLQRHKPDVVLIESPVLDGDFIQRCADIRGAAGARGVVVVYSFATSQDIDRARRDGFVVVRGPADVDEARAAILRAASGKAVATPLRNEPSASEPAGDWQFAGPIAPRLFTQQQLAALATASTAIDCECPHQLAHLVGDLSAFEIYSAGCANRNDDDAALHRYLHQTTAQARALIEIALKRVAEAEGLAY
jgi:DNA-binding NarL/FixJ family response regulator